MSNEFDDYTLVNDKSFVLDLLRKKKIFITLQDGDGDTIEVKDIAENVAEFIVDKMKSSDEENSTIQKAYPLLSQSMKHIVSKLIGPEMLILLSIDKFRQMFTNMMMSGFYIAQFMRKNNININHSEEELTEEEIEQEFRLSQGINMLSLAACAGYDPKEVVATLIKNNIITRDDLKILGLEEPVFENSDNDDTDNSN